MKLRADDFNKRHARTNETFLGRMPEDQRIEATLKTMKSQPIRSRKIAEYGVVPE